MNASPVRAFEARLAGYRPLAERMSVAVRTLVEKVKGPVGWVLVFLLLAVFLFIGTYIGERNGFFLMLTTIAILYGVYFLASAFDVIVRLRLHQETGPVDRGFIPMNFLVGTVIILGAVWAIFALVPSIENEIHPKAEAPIVYTG